MPAAKTPAKFTPTPATRMEDVTVSIRLPFEVHARLEAVATKSQVTVAAAVEQFLAWSLDHGVLAPAPRARRRRDKKD